MRHARTLRYLLVLVSSSASILCRSLLCCVWLEFSPIASIPGAGQRQNSFRETMRYKVVKKVLVNSPSHADKASKGGILSMMDEALESDSMMVDFS